MTMARPIPRKSCLTNRGERAGAGFPARWIMIDSPPLRSLLALFLLSKSGTGSFIQSTFGSGEALPQRPPVLYHTNATGALAAFAVPFKSALYLATAFASEMRSATSLRPISRSEFSTIFLPFLFCSSMT